MTCLFCSLLGASLVCFHTYVSSSRWNIWLVFVPFCVLGQSVHLGMGGSWSCAVLRNFWTFCHILLGLLYLLLHWRVSNMAWMLPLTIPKTLPTMFFFLCSFLFFSGFAVTLLYGKINSEKYLEKCEHSYLPPTQIGIHKVSAAP